MHESLNAGTPEVLADETQIHQIVMNLATNAAHAMEGGGTLDVRLAPFPVSAAFASTHPDLKPGTHARLTVIDTGQGMAPEVLERALEPFFTTKPPGSGTGLGLSVIHGIVKSQGGAIEISSRIGEGTRVDIFLPAAESVAPRPAGSESAPAPGERRHILLVEDEKSLAMMERRQLEALGYRVTAHTSSVEALDDFIGRSDQFDLLITDNTMPHLPGLVLAERVHTLRPELPILMVSGLAEATDAESLKSKGIGKVLRKPHTGLELGAAIRELLSRR
jgi:hypothetical protein